MRYPEVSDWFNRALLRRQSELNKRISVTEFGDMLNRSQPTISAYLNGTRKPSYPSALEISELLNDYTLLDILGYSHPEPREVPLSSLPPELLKRLEAIDAEIKAAFIARNITESSPEAEELVRSIISKYGVTFT